MTGPKSYIGADKKGVKSQDVVVFWRKVDDDSYH